MLLLILLTTCCVPALSQQDTEVDDEIFTRSGDTVVLPCNETMPTQALGFVPYLLQWVRTDLPYPLFIGFGPYPPYIDEQYTGRISIVDGLAMKIDNVRPEDDGWYTCQIVRLDGPFSTEGKNATLRHLVVMDIGNCESDPCMNGGTCTDNVNGYICECPDGWTGLRCDTDINECESDPCMNGGTCTDNVNGYICECLDGWTGLPCDTEQLVITQELRDESGLEDFPIAFICKASGNPAPKFDWMQGNRKVSNTRFTIIEIPNGSILWIESLKSPRDDSEYSCVATNSEGKASSSANLTVYVATSLPRGFPEIISPPRVSVVEKHRQAVMSCGAVGNPDPDIIWFRDMKPVDTSSDRIQMRDSSTIIIDNVDETDQGRYQCAARNSVGTRYSAAASFYVKERLVPPRFTIEPVDMEVVSSGSVDLTCVAVGTPMPAVKWTHAGVDLTKGELPIGRNVLQLTNVEETGEYTCVAMSKLGTIQTSATITVRRTTSITNRPTSNSAISSTTELKTTSHDPNGSTFTELQYINKATAAFTTILRTTRDHPITSTTELHSNTTELPALKNTAAASASELQATGSQDATLTTKLQTASDPPADHADSDSKAAVQSTSNDSNEFTTELQTTINDANDLTTEFQLTTNDAVVSTTEVQASTTDADDFTTEFQSTTNDAFASTTDRQATEIGSTYQEITSYQELTTYQELTSTSNNDAATTSKMSTEYESDICYIADEITTSQDCSMPLGVANGLIQDVQITASSENSNIASHARLNGKTFWSALSTDCNPWIQVDLKTPMTISGVITQGSGQQVMADWVTKLRIDARNDTSSSWACFTSSGFEMVFQANEDGYSEKTILLPYLIRAQFLRIKPKSWLGYNADGDLHRNCQMRFEILGCE